MELLRTSGGRVFCLIARFSPGLGLALAFWVVHVWVFSGSPSGSKCSVLCFRHGCDVVLRDLLCSSVGGLHCTGPANARQNRMGERYSLWGRSGFPGPLRAMHRRRCVQFLFATGCSVKVGSSISVSFWAPDAWARGCWLSVTKRYVLCPLGRSHSCCRSVSSL